jgi:6-pyruvoyltetrahydropterin/6-carboxytetrahydropterin synthase
MIRVTRQYRFAASHRLHSPALSGEENRLIYGKCNNPYGHGHNYFLQICTRGPIDGETGLALDVRVLDRLVEETLMPALCDRNLNDLPAFERTVPTTENLALLCEQELRRKWASWFPDGPALVGVRIRETRRNVFETGGMRA